MTAVKKKPACKAVRVTASGRREPSFVPEPGARCFKLTDGESEAVARMMLPQLARSGPTPKKSARRCVVAAAIVVVEAGVSQSDFLFACKVEYLRAADMRRQLLACAKKKTGAAGRPVAKAKRA